uniref:Uncharacterized protein n=1 Tax=Arundo donax TaxID=35708 RepID=A0A0A9EUV2_ARUDO
MDTSACTHTCSI